MSYDGSGRIEINGVPVLRGRSVEGRCAGGLVFRVGMADETFASRGVTHLVEHLALNQTDPTKVHSNGTTGSDVTHFYASGTSDEVRDFLNLAAAGLRELPLHRVAAEIEILRTEEAGRSTAPGASLPTWRYGAQGYGLSSYDEFGLRRLTADDVAAWAAACFTSGNCIAWLAADEVPEGLDLRLPEGSRRPRPALTPVIEQFPSYYRGGPPNVVVSESIVPRTANATIYTSVLEQILFRHLRQDGGMSYRIATNYEPLTQESAAVSATADALPEKQSTLVNRFVECLAGLRKDVPEEMLAAALANRRTMYEQPHLESLRLAADAVSLLHGVEPVTTADLLAELDTVDATGVRDIASTAFETLLLQTPTNDAELGRLHPAPIYSDRAVAGTRHPLDDGRTTIVIGDDGVSSQTPDGVATVLWHDVVGALSYPDGRRDLIGRDGFFVSVDPRRLKVKGATLAPVIDGRVDPSVVVPMPAREPEKPAAAAAGRRAWWVWPLILLGIAALVGIAVIAAAATHVAALAVVLVVLGLRLTIWTLRRSGARASR